MKDLLSILRDAPGSIRLEVSGEDLLAFSKSLIDRAKEELALWCDALAVAPPRISESR